VIEWMWMLVVRFPRLTSHAGRALMTLAVIVLLLVWRGHLLLALLDRRLARVDLDGPTSLAEMFPTWLTWWIPESPVGYLGALVLFAVGAGLGWIGCFALRHLLWRSQCS
jgi:hypothetical protein